MPNLRNEALLPLREAMLPNVKALIKEAQRLNSIMLDTYQKMIESGSSDPLDARVLAALKMDTHNILFALNHQVDLLELIGSPAQQVKFFNFKDGEMVEVKRHEYAGTIDDDIPELLS